MILESIPTDEEKEKIKNLGLSFVEYVPISFGDRKNSECMFVVSFSENIDVSNLQNLGIKAMLPILPEYKIDPRLQGGVCPEYALDGENRLLKVPSISWISRHSFRFRNNNKFYIYNNERGFQSNSIFSIKEKAASIDFNNQNNKYAYTIDNNLFIATGSDNHMQISNEDNSNIVFGQVVHRYEFGISKGTFWSNDGSKLAFYRKDESMVTDYPLINTSSRVGNVDMIKYPMSGMTSHQVLLGVYNSNNNKTIYLQTGFIH